MGNVLTAVIVLRGRVAGTWKKTVHKNTIEIRLSPYREFSRSERESLKSEVVRYGEFFGLPAVEVQ